MLKERSIDVSRLVSLSALVAAASVLGCGSPPPAENAASTPIAAAPLAKEEAPELSPVAAPPELIALARFKKPQTAIETMGAWANFPFKLTSVIPADLKGLESVVAWDAPLEAAVALDPAGEGKVPEPLAVVSLGLTSLDGALEFARSKGQSVSRLRPGVYRIGESDDVSCAASVAVGSAPARLVCGHRAHDVEGLLAYATRGLPNEPLPNLDFQMELRLEPVKKKYEAEIGSARLFAGFLLREVQVDNPRFDRALSDVAYTLVDETIAFVHDLDKLRVSSNVDAQKNLVNLRFDTMYKGQKSWLVQASVETLPMAPPPDLFWQLPADSSAASYTLGYKPARLKPIGRTLGELLDGYLDAQKVPTKLRNQATKALESMFDNAITKQVRAQGELSEIPKDPSLAAAYRLFGWSVGSAEVELKSVQGVFDNLAAISANPELAKVLKDRLKVDGTVLPKLTARAVQVKGFKPGAKAYRLDIPQAVFEKYAKSEWAALVRNPVVKAKGPVKMVPVSFVLASDGDRTWIGMSPDEKALLKRLELLKDPKQPTLASKPGLEALKGKPVLAGGFATLARFSGQFGALAGKDGELGKLITNLPHHGETPILFDYEVTVAGPQIGMGFTVPRAAVEDLGALVPVLAVMAKSHSPMLAE